MERARPLEQSDAADAGSRALPHRLALLAAAGTLLLISAGLRATGQVPQALTGSAGSMTRYESLRAHVDLAGPSDVVAIGSSVIRSGVAPQVVASALEETLPGGRRLRVFNFGVAGHNVLTYPFLVGLVEGVDRPRVFVMHVGPRVIDPGVEHLEEWAEVVRTSAYGQAILDPYRLRGRIDRWLLDHFTLRSYAPTLRAELLGEQVAARPGRKPRKRGGLDPQRGFRRAPRKELNAKRTERQREIVAAWRTDPRYARALDAAVARARGAGARVLLVDSPRSGRLLELMEDPQRSRAGTRRFMDDARRRLGIEVAYAPPGLVDDEDFADFSHLLPSGAESYSRWLAGELARRFPELSAPR